jgi:hypothetical protein
VGVGQSGSVIFANMGVSDVRPLEKYLFLEKYLLLERGNYIAFVPHPDESIETASGIDSKFRLKLTPLDIPDCDVFSLKGLEYVRFYAHTLETLASLYSKGKYRSEKIPVILKGTNNFDGLFSFFHAEIEGDYLSVLDFLKMPTVQKLTKEGLASLSSAIKTLAETEGLEAHKKSVEMREK